MFFFIFTYVILLYETRKNPKFEGLKINNGGDMAILRFLKIEGFVKILKSYNFEEYLFLAPLRSHEVFFIYVTTP